MHKLKTVLDLAVEDLAFLTISSGSADDGLFYEQLGTITAVIIGIEFVCQVAALE